VVTRTNRPPSGSLCAPRGAILTAALVAACGGPTNAVDGPDAWVPPPPAELCNGVDDDSDGMSDEGYTPGEPCPGAYPCSDPAACRCAPSHALCEGLCFERSLGFRTATCGGACVLIDANDDNCGACGRRCAAGLRCDGGRCVCPALTCNGVCTEYDNNNCGACGRRCPLGAICQPLAQFTCQCPRPSAPCGPGGACVSVAFDDNNCGGCGARCPPGSYCYGTSCAWR
jgi:hypothetical protein